MSPKPLRCRFLLWVLTVMAFLAAGSAFEVEGAGVGPGAAAASAVDTEGPAPRIVPAAEFRLDDYAGRVVLLDFWASWCKPCRKSIPWLAEMQHRLGPRGLTVVAVNLDKDIAVAKDLLKGLGAEVVVVADPDGTLAEKFQLQGMPSSFHFDREGRQAGSHVGFLPEETPAREAEIVKLLESGAK